MTLSSFLPASSQLKTRGIIDVSKLQASTHMPYLFAPRSVGRETACDDLRMLSRGDWTGCLQIRAWGLGFSVPVAE